MNKNPVLALKRRRRKALQQKRQERRAAKRARTLANMPPPMPFVVGVNRSGTTLLRMMLDAHPELTVPPETHFIPAFAKEFKERKNNGEKMTADDAVDFLVGHRRWGDFGLDEAVLRERVKKLDKVRPKYVLRAFFGLYAESQGKTRVGDKTPGYVKQMGIIQRTVPEARFIHLIRDGRDVALSRESRMSAEELTVERHAKIWKRRISRARRQQSRLKHYIELRYEDLIADPETALRKVCDFIELPYDPAMLEYHERSADRLQEIARDLDDDNGGALRPAAERVEAHSLVTEAPRSDRVDRWRELMPPSDIVEFETIAGDLLDELGYEVTTSEGRETAAASASESESSPD